MSFTDYYLQSRIDGDIGRVIAGLAICNGALLCCGCGDPAYSSTLPNLAGTQTTVADVVWTCAMLARAIG
ncbi:hypothetical protein V493_07190 [Pseudogymnoascus sp. VKM F-4281 (FW-2241)]|nr:hypothetical protein V493_07190 [Pseudogymnoascus sp. VKM F-4281 (FW-2241)]